MYICITISELITQLVEQTSESLAFYVYMQNQYTEVSFFLVRRLVRKCKSSQPQLINCSFHHIILIYIYEKFVCMFVCMSVPTLGPKSPKLGWRPKTGQKAQKEGRRPQNWAEDPVWGYLTPTQTEINRAYCIYQKGLKFAIYTM